MTTPPSQTGPVAPSPEPDPAWDRRTDLAWQRTTLAVVAGAAFLTRLTSDRLGLVALVSLGVALPLGLWLLWEHRATRGHLHDYRSPGARATFALLVAVVALGLTELAALLR